MVLVLVCPLKELSSICRQSLSIFFLHCLRSSVSNIRCASSNISAVSGYFAIYFRRLQSRPRRDLLIVVVIALVAAFVVAFVVVPFVMVAIAVIVATALAALLVAVTIVIAPVIALLVAVFDVVRRFEQVRRYRSF